AGVQALGLSLFPSGTPSNAVTATALPAAIDGNKVTKIARDKYGACIAGGQDQLKGKIVRIAHLGFVSIFDAVDAMACFEWTLAEMKANVPVGEGTKAVMKALANPLSPD